MLQTQRHLICFERMFAYSFNVFVSSSEDAASLEPTAPSCREDKFRHPCCDHMGGCAFSKAPCRCLLFAALPTNSLKHPHNLEAMSAHETAQLLRKVVEFNTLISRLVTHSEVLRDGSIDISAVHCPRGQVFTHVANLNFPFAPSLGSFRGCVNARCLFILALSLFCGTNGFPLFCTNVGFHPGSSPLEFSFASGWQRVLRNRHRNRKMMTRSSSRCT